MRITAIRCVDVDITRHGGETAADDGRVRGPAWTTQRWAGPMDRYPAAVFGSAAPPASKHLFGVVVETEDGTSGFGLGHQGRAAAALIEDVLAPTLVGQNVMAHEALYDMAVRRCAAFSAGGLASYAISAIDVAVWDAKGRILVDRCTSSSVARHAATCLCTRPVLTSRGIGSWVSGRSSCRVRSVPRTGSLGYARLWRSSPGPGRWPVRTSS